MSASPITTTRGSVTRTVSGTDAASADGIDLSTSTHDEPRGHDVPGAGGVIAVESCEDPFGGQLADALRILGHHGDTGFEEVGQRHIVEADESDAVVQVAGAEGPDGADGDEVLGAEDSRGRVVRR